MKIRIAWLLLAALLLTGCGTWMDGSYVYIEPYHKENEMGMSGDYKASNYLELRNILAGMVDSGLEKAIINVLSYDQTMLASSAEMAVNYAAEVYPLGAYAVEHIDYEIGTRGGQPAMWVHIHYRYGRSEISKIRQEDDMQEAKTEIFHALEDCVPKLVMLVKGYEPMDLTQLVEDYAELYPDVVMEIPEVSVGVYPDNGCARIIELKFDYETSRDVLRQMQNQVRPVFDAAKLYVSGEGAEEQKYAQLCSFLMERFEYDLETSITPSYSLLRHGVGDSKAFASVYAAMCRQAGLECVVVTGARDGQTWFWNMIRVGDGYYHVDLLRCSKEGRFRKLVDEDMSGYVWDYSAFPLSTLRPMGVLTQETVEQNTEAPPEADPRHTGAEYEK